MMGGIIALADFYIDGDGHSHCVNTASTFKGVLSLAVEPEREM